MHSPVLSIDVAKERSTAAAFLSYGQLFRKPFSFDHSVAGLSSLLPLLQRMEEETNQKPFIVMEATGHYSKPLVSYFTELGVPVILLNPLQTHLLKKKAVRKVKTDPIDATRIAQAFYLNGGIPVPSHDPITLELRTLCRQYDHLNGLYAEVQLHYRAVLDLLFPGFGKAFAKIASPTALRLLSAFPTPKDILHADPDALLQNLMVNRRGRAWNEEKLHLLFDLAREAVPDSHGVMANRLSLKCYIDLLKTYQQALDEIERTMLHLVKAHPIYALLRSIPGVGRLTAAVILAEIGEIKRFPGSKQLTAFAGLDAAVFESGTFKANRNRISKRGSLYLRKALYQATVAGISKQAKGPRNPILSRYYQQKLAEGKPSKVAIIATCHKLLRMIYGIWSSGLPFQVS